jgi:hypothetical protein
VSQGRGPEFKPDLQEKKKKKERKKKKGCRSGSSGRTSAKPVQSPEFKLQYCCKK